jgi:hypothetical protein
MCGGNHNFKQKASVSASAAASGAEGGTKKRASSRRTKEDAVFVIDPRRPIKSYDMNTSFSAGDVISHPKFGLGAVETSLPPNKIEVRFQEGKKLLLHNMKNFRS